jgi:hypothetical protein
MLKSTNKAVLVASALLLASCAVRERHPPSLKDSPADTPRAAAPVYKAPRNAVIPPQATRKGETGPPAPRNADEERLREWCAKRHLDYWQGEAKETEEEVAAGNLLCARAYRNPVETKP